MQKGSSENMIIEITPSTIVKGVLVLLGFYTLFLLRDLVMVLLTSIVVASSVEPAAAWLIRRRLPRVLAVITVYLAFLSVFIGAFYFFLPPLVKDLGQFVSSFPQYLQFLEKWNPWKDIFDYSTFAASFFQGTSVSDFAPGVAKSVQGISGGVAQIAGTFFGGVVSFILVLVLSFYLAVQEKGIENFLKIIVPAKNERYIIGLWHRSREKIGKWMQGQLLLGVFVGALVFLGLVILNVPHPFLLAIVAAFFELIPVFGPTLSAIPAVIVGFGVSATTGFMVVGLYVIIQQFENHLIYPVVVRKVVGVPPIMVILALLIGAELAGFMGIILSVPLAAALMELVDDVEKKKLGTFEKDA